MRQNYLNSPAEIVLVRIAEGQDDFFVLVLARGEDAFDFVVLLEELDDRIELVRFKAIAVFVHHVS